MRILVAAGLSFLLAGPLLVHARGGHRTGDRMVSLDARGSGPIDCGALRVEFGGKVATVEEESVALFAGASGTAVAREPHPVGSVSTVKASASERVAGQPLKSASTNATIDPVGIATLSDVAPDVEPTSESGAPLTCTSTR